MKVIILKLKVTSENIQLLLSLDYVLLQQNSVVAVFDLQKSIDPNQIILWAKYKKMCKLPMQVTYHKKIHDSYVFSTHTCK